MSTIDTRREFRRKMQEKYLPQMPAIVADAVFRKAWDDGHADGLYAVEQEYEEIAEIASAAFKAGANSTDPNEH